MTTQLMNPENHRRYRRPRWGLAISLLALFALSCASSEDPRVRLRDEGSSDSLQVRWQTYEGPAGGPPIEIKLVNMIHIGDEDFFVAVQGELDDQDLVFMEGVNGGRLIAELKRLYIEVASRFAMTTQSNIMRKREHFRSGDVTEEEIESELHDVLIRLNLASSRLERQLQRQAARIQNKFPDWEAADCERAAALGPLRSDLAESLLDESSDDPVLVGDRNQRLLLALGEVLEERPKGLEKIAICYGVAHSSEVEEWLRDRGYLCSSTSWHTVFRAYDDLRATLGVQAPEVVTP